MILADLGHYKFIFLKKWLRQTCQIQENNTIVNINPLKVKLALKY